MTYDAGLGAVVLFGGAANGIWEDSLNDTLVPRVATLGSSLWPPDGPQTGKVANE